MPSPTRPELQQVLRGIVANRVPGFNFPGNFLAVSFDRVGPRESTLSLVPGPHCTGADGGIDLAALCILADIALATSIRARVGRGAHMATVQLSLQFPGTLGGGALTAHNTMDAFVDAALARQALSRVEIRQRGRLVCTGSAAFMVLQSGNATPPHPMPRRGDAKRAAKGLDVELREEEKPILRRAQRAARGGDATFLARLFGIEPRRTTAGASCKTPIGLHIGNRVGNVQGGILLGMATATACAAAPPGWKLVGVSSWFTRPGQGDFLRTTSCLVHAGRSTAVVRSEVRDPDGDLVLMALASHAATGAR